VPRQNRAGTGRLDARERFERAVELLDERRCQQRRPDIAGRSVERDERVAGEEDVAAFDVQDAGARRVPRCVNHARRTGDVEALAVAERRHVRDRLDLQAACAHDVDDVAEEERADECCGDAERRRAAAVPACVGRLGLVHEHTRPGLAPEALGAAEMVGMRVREQERVDVAERLADRAEQRGKLRPVRREAGVEHGQTAAVLDHIPVDVPIAETMNSLGDLGHSAFTSCTSLTIDALASPNSITVFGL
jgi:hypothetical protein